MNKEEKLNMNASDYAFSHINKDKAYNGFEVFKMLCAAYIAGNNDTLDDALNDEAYRKAYYDGYNKCNRDWIYSQEEQKASCTTIAETGDGEHKSVNKIKPKFKVGDKIQYLKGCGTIMTIEKIENGEYIFANNMGHTTIENGNKCYLVEQKSDENKGNIGGISSNWSEGDESILESVIKDVMASHSNRTVEGFLCKLNWVKSIKGRIQPKQEWSEEDEDYINDLIKYFSQNERLKNTKEDIVIWLKSLRPQNRWKPSDEQMEALDSATENCAYSEYQDCLRELIGQLKKLREE